MMSDDTDTASTEMEYAHIISPTAGSVSYSDQQQSHTYLNTAANMLGLKMRLKAPQEFLSDQECDDLADRINVMRKQEETTYKVFDYVQRRSGEDAATRTLDGTYRTDTSDKTIYCREKMVDWSFHIVDHFGLSREIVEIAFSYMDRFLDRCSCDKTVFKLSCMTCLYVAAKNTGPKYVPLSTLSELSEGEFKTRHFIRMENIILDTLHWRVQPPTTKAFIDHFITLLPSNKIAMKQSVLRRANFFAELSVFDYNFCTEKPSLIALGSILNAIHDIYPRNMAEMLSTKLKGELLYTIKLDFHTIEIDAVQERLWYLFRDSEQYQVCEANKLRLLGAVATSCVCTHTSKLSTNADVSPVSVLTDAMPWI